MAKFKRGGVSDKEIRANEAQIPAANAARDHPPLAQRVAAAGPDRRCREDRSGAEEDAALEIESIAAHTDESVRRVREVEKEGGPDSLMTQILERKVVDRTLEETVIEDIQTTIEPEEDVDTIDYVFKTPAAAGEAGQHHMNFKERSMHPEPPLADPFLPALSRLRTARQMTLRDILLENRIAFLKG